MAHRPFASAPYIVGRSAPSPAEVHIPAEESLCPVVSHDWVNAEYKHLIVEASPKAQDTGFERVRLGLQGKSLAAMELFDQLGGHTMLRFSDFKANAPVSPDTFRFTPPKGADVIEDAPKK